MEEEVGLLRSLIIKLTGRAFIGYWKKPGWRQSLPFYVFECPVHGYVEDYPHGYRNRLECPHCYQEDLELILAVEDEAIMSEMDQTLVE